MESSTRSSVGYGIATWSFFDSLCCCCHNLHCFSLWGQSYEIKMRITIINQNNLWTRKLSTNHLSRMDAAEPLSARSRYYISSVQIPYQHGARNISARRKKFSCTASQCRFHVRNNLFQRRKQLVSSVKVCYFHSESMLFFHSRKHFSCNYPLNFN